MRRRSLHRRPSGLVVPGREPWSIPDLWIPGQQRRHLPAYPCCCGGSTCTVFSDGFGRADSTDIGSGWTEQSGDWSIASGKLTTNSTWAVATVSPSFGVSGFAGHVIDVAVVGAYSDRVRIVFNYTDTNNYWAAELRFAGSSPSVHIISRSGGSETILASKTLDAAVLYLRVCVTEYRVWVSTQGASTWVNQLVYSYATGFTSNVCGLGTGTAAAGVSFDNFLVQRHNDDNSACPGCSYCVDCPTGEDPPDEFEVTLSGLTLKSGFTYSDSTGLLAYINNTFLVKYRSPCAWQFGCVYTGFTCSGTYSGTPFTDQPIWFLLSVEITKNQSNEPAYRINPMAGHNSGCGTCNEATGNVSTVVDCCAPPFMPPELTRKPDPFTCRPDDWTESWPGGTYFSNFCYSVIESSSPVYTLTAL